MTEWWGCLEPNVQDTFIMLVAVFCCVVLQHYWDKSLERRGKTRWSTRQSAKIAPWIRGCLSIAILIYVVWFIIVEIIPSIQSGLECAF